MTCTAWDDCACGHDPDNHYLAGIGALRCSDCTTAARATRQRTGEPEPKDYGEPDWATYI
jgi:hypothetical protein